MQLRHALGEGHAEQRLAGALGQGRDGRGGGVRQDDGDGAGAGEAHSGHWPPLGRVELDGFEGDPEAGAAGVAHGVEGVARLHPVRQRQLEADAARGEARGLGQGLTRRALEAQLDRRERGPAQRQQVREPLAGAGGEVHGEVVRSRHGVRVGDEAQVLVLGARHGGAGYRVEVARGLCSRGQPAVEGGLPLARLERQAAQDRGVAVPGEQQHPAAGSDLAGELEAAAGVGGGGEGRRIGQPLPHRAGQRSARRVEADRDVGKRPAVSVVVRLADQEAARLAPLARGQEEGGVRRGHDPAAEVCKRGADSEAHRLVAPPGV